MSLRNQRHPLRTLLFPILTFLLVTFVFAANQAQAAPSAGGFSADTAKSGFSGPGTSSGMSTVAEALKMSDDSPVSLKGSVIKQVGSEKYEFKDDTGMIILDIDDDVWWGQTVTPANVVIISGEIDHDLDEFQNTMEVDVDRVEIVKE